MEHPKTLFEKIWDAHVVRPSQNDVGLIYIDLHLVHEVTSPQAFTGLRNAGRPVHAPAKTIATVDHNISTRTKDLTLADPISRNQIDTLSRNCAEFGVKLFDFTDMHQGIVHVIGPELGLILPGMTTVCGDSHTATHGALGALAFGIGTSEVEHVLATQTLQQNKPKTMKIAIDGELSPSVTGKDIILHIIGLIGTAGGTGYVIEYAGSAIRELSMEARMTVCNMSIEAGARAGMIAPDEKTFEYLKGRHYAPFGGMMERAEAYWKTLPSDEGAVYDKVIEIDAATIKPMVTWGTSPGQVVSVDGTVPNPDEFTNPVDRQAGHRALEYMGLVPYTKISDIKIDKVFIGSCTNGRIEDLRAAAGVVKGQKVAAGVQAIVVPGSETVRRQAEEEGLNKVFTEAGLEWRFAGCSMCLGMNDDQLKAGERCASTSNRNFEGRQGPGGRTHLMSPQMAAMAAIAGRIVDIRNKGDIRHETV